MDLRYKRKDLWCVRRCVLKMGVCCVGEHTLHIGEEPTRDKEDISAVVCNSILCAAPLVAEKRHAGTQSL